MRAARCLAIVVVVSALPLFGQPLIIIGNEITGTPDTDDGPVGVIRTDIDLAQPARVTGTVSSVTVYWSMEPMPGCTNAFKIRFFRRVGDTLTMTEERGPFHPGPDLYTAALTPAVRVEQGDLIGITRLSNCGNPTAFSTPAGEGYLQFPGDVTGTIEMSAAAAHRSGTLAIYGTGTVIEGLTLTVPVVGSAPGAFGSFFRTELQILRSDLVISGSSLIVKLVFRRAGVPGSSGDATMAFALGASELFSSADIVADLHSSGLGSLDVIMPKNAGLIIVQARVYDDAGAEGTSGLTEEGIFAFDEAGELPQTTFLGRGAYGYLITPRDPSRTRFNVGVRTFHRGATIEATLRDAHGTVIRRKTHTFTATWFVQMAVADFVGGPIFGGETIFVRVRSGSAFVYGSTTDNVTNDPAIQFVRRIGVEP